MEQKLYFIAILPDPPIQAEVTAFKQHAADHFGAAHALKSPPHITLIPPFRHEEKREAELRACLEKFARSESAFVQKLENFACFPPRVIYVDAPVTENLLLLQQSLEERLKSELGLEKSAGGPGFHPHMTVAFRDLERKRFAGAWNYFSKIIYRREFLVNAISLLKHDGHRWEAAAHFPLAE